MKKFNIINKNYNNSFTHDYTCNMNGGTNADDDYDDNSLLTSALKSTVPYDDDSLLTSALKSTVSYDDNSLLTPALKYDDGIEFGESIISDGEIFKTYLQQMYQNQEEKNKVVVLKETPTRTVIANNNTNQIFKLINTNIPEFEAILLKMIEYPLVYDYCLKKSVYIGPKMTLYGINLTNVRLFREQSLVEIKSHKSFTDAHFTHILLVMDKLYTMNEYISAMGEKTTKDNNVIITTDLNRILYYKLMYNLTRILHTINEYNIEKSIANDFFHADIHLDNICVVLDEKSTVKKFGEISEYSFDMFHDLTNLDNYSFVFIDWDSETRHNPLTYKDLMGKRTTFFHDVQAIKSISNNFSFFKDIVDPYRSEYNHFTLEEKEEIKSYMTLCNSNFMVTSVIDLHDYFKQQFLEYIPIAKFETSSMSVSGKKKLLCLDFDQTCTPMPVNGYYNLQGLLDINLTPHTIKIIVDTIKSGNFVAICSFGEYIFNKTDDCVLTGKPLIKFMLEKDLSRLLTREEINSITIASYLTTTKIFHIRDAIRALNKKKIYFNELDILLVDDDDYNVENIKGLYTNIKTFKVYPQNKGITEFHYETIKLWLSDDKKFMQKLVLYKNLPLEKPKTKYGIDYSKLCEVDDPEYKWFLSKINYISYDDWLKNMKLALEKYKLKYGNNYYLLLTTETFSGLLLPKFDYTKSARWVYQHLADDIDCISIITNPLEIIQILKNNSNVNIMCLDDVIYSGTQFTRIIQMICEFTKKFSYETKISNACFSAVISYSSDKFQSNIKKAMDLCNFKIENYYGSMHYTIQTILTNKAKENLFIDETTQTLKSEDLNKLTLEYDRLLNKFKTIYHLIIKEIYKKDIDGDHLFENKYLTFTQFKIANLYIVPFVMFTWLIVNCDYNKQLSYIIYNNFKYVYSSKPFEHNVLGLDCPVNPYKQK